VHHWCFSFKTSVVWIGMLGLYGGVYGSGQFWYFIGRYIEMTGGIL